MIWYIIIRNQECCCIYISRLIFISLFRDWIRFFRWNRVDPLMSSNDATFDYWDQLILDMQLPQGLANKHSECWLCLPWFRCIQQTHHEPVFNKFIRFNGLKQIGTFLVSTSKILSKAMREWLEEMCVWVNLQRFVQERYRGYHLRH